MNSVIVLYLNCESSQTLLYVFSSQFTFPITNHPKPQITVCTQYRVCRQSQNSIYILRFLMCHMRLEMHAVECKYYCM